MSNLEPEQVKQTESAPSSPENAPESPEKKEESALYYTKWQQRMMKKGYVVTPKVKKPAKQNAIEWIATLVGALLLGVSRTVAAEFTFFLAIPVMFGASLLKILKFGFAFTSTELMILGIGTITAFVSSLLIIRFLMSFVKKHDFKVFGWYRIILGIAVLAYFMLAK